jgi:5-methylcytosine-specific restriction endonuclease McrA
MVYNKIDQQALKISKEFKRCESELLDIIIKVDDLKVYRKMGYPSLFQYVTNRLELSEAQAYNFINVGRKAKEVPQIREKIKNGELSVSKAKKITSVITPINQEYWLNLAQSASQKKVEREVAIANPKQAIWDEMTYVSPLEKVIEKIQIKKNSPQVKMQVGLSEKLMLKLRRAQDLVSQKKKSSVNLELTLEALVDDYINKHDPVEKAKRQKIKGRLNLKIKQDSKIERASKTEPTSRIEQVSKVEQVLKIKQISKRLQVLRTETKEKAETQVLIKQTTTGNRLIEMTRQQKFGKRRFLPAQIKHQVYLSNKGQCSSTDEDGKRCAARRFLDIHHIQPVSQGGSDELENLTLLCSGHHQAIHHNIHEKDKK